MISDRELAEAAPLKSPPTRPPPLSEEIFKAITDVLVAVLAYVVIVHVARYYDQAKVVHYDRLLGFSITFVILTLALRLTKKPMGNLLTNGLYFSLAGIFANDILGK